jgi:cathepsin D
LLDLDTGSSLLWVQSRLSTDDIVIPDQSQYTPSTSKTAKETPQTQDVNYGDGSQVKATIFTDDVHVETLLAQEQSIGAVSSKNLSTGAVQGKSNGLIGLGFAKEESTGFVQTLQRQGAIRYASISMVGPRNDPNVAQKIDKEKIMEPRGHLIVGSVDSKFYTGEIAWCPQIPNFDSAVRDRWIVKLDAILLNGVEIQELKDQYALIDTGTSYIVTSPTNMQTFRHAVGAGARPLSRAKPYMWAYPSKPVSSITSISFKLGGRTIELHPGDLSLGQDLAPDKDGVIRSVSSICTLPGTWPFAPNLWVLGGIFIDNVVTIFDFGARKVGFADISEHDLEQNAAA